VDFTSAADLHSVGLLDGQHPSRPTPRTSMATIPGPSFACCVCAPPLLGRVPGRDSNRRPHRATTPLSPEDLADRQERATTLAAQFRTEMLTSTPL
jgi:hypothetical protein